MSSDPRSDNETPVTPLSTPNGGELHEAVDNAEPAPQGDLVQDALADARGMARGNRSRRRLPSRRQRSSDGTGSAAEADRARRRTWSAAGVDPDRDPQAMSSIMRAVFAERGWQRPVTEARVFTDWPGLVGADVAAHCSPTSLRDGELKISAQSSAWATQIRLLAPSLLARLSTELGAGVVQRLVVTGPSAPSWKHGYRSVPGARGPRDTYG